MTTRGGSRERFHKNETAVQRVNVETEIHYWKPILCVGLVLLTIVWLWPESEQSAYPSKSSLSSFLKSTSVITPAKSEFESPNYVTGSMSIVNYSEINDLVLDESAPQETRNPRDSFLLASMISYPFSLNGTDNLSNISALPTNPDTKVDSPVQKLAHDLEKAQVAVLAGDRTRALYHTRSATGDIQHLPEPWRQILRDFRSSLISDLDAAPAIPKLDDWVTLSPVLKNIPTDAPIVLYVDKDTFTMHVVKNGETVWQLPVGLGYQNSTPEGIFTIGTKISNPTWYNKGNPVATDSPDNPLGEQWFGLSDGADSPLTYGVHPTENLDSIGETLSRGCIRMRPQDAQKLFNIIPLGTPIVIGSGTGY